MKVANLAVVAELAAEMLETEPAGKLLVETFFLQRTHYSPIRVHSGTCAAILFFELREKDNLWISNH